ncbi:hypothetical protein FKM82_004427 [Ascaphus truei]
MWRPRDVELNVRDKWDSTPLYYACLCGHEELVRYLLANGAKCEVNTFDGERCLYGALSDAIRRLLKEYKRITAKCMQRDYYDDFLQRLLEQGSLSDTVFIVHGESFGAHRCVLSARSPYFAEMFDTKWKGKKVIALKHPLINPAAFGPILQYLYTGRMDIDVEHVEDCKRLAKQCRLQDLIEELEDKCKKVYEFVSSKPGTCVKVLTVEPSGNCRLQEDLAILADCALPAELRVGFGELPFDSTDNFSSYPDVAPVQLQFLWVTIRFSAVAAITSRLCWRITSARARSCRPSRASPPSPCTTSPRTPSRASYIIYTAMTPSCPQRTHTRSCAWLTCICCPG